MGDNTKIIKNLFYYLERHLFGADSDQGEDLINKGEFGVMMTPGQFVSPNWMESTGSNDMYNQFVLLDSALDTSFSYLPLVTTISGQYSRALDLAALRHRPLTKKEKDELDQINLEISQLQPTYDLYKNRYEDAAEAYDFEASKPNPNQGKLQRLLDDKNEAYNNWDTIGQKQYYEDDLVGQAWQIQNGNPDGEWTRMRAQYRNSTKIAPLGQYQTTLLTPPISQWQNAGWATFSKTITDTETHQYSHSVSWSAGIGAQWGLFDYVDVGAGGSKTVRHDISDVTSIDTTFDYIRCRIIRPWLDSNLFACKDWTWKQPNTFVYLSDGGNLAASPPVRPIGNMPFLHTSVVVVRNVVIRANFSHNDVQEMNEQINGSIDAGFGCFGLRGSYQESTHTVDVKATFDGTELRIPNPQIIGFLGTLLPKSPDPDQHLPYWPDTAVFPDSMSEPDRKGLVDAREYDMALSRVRRKYRGVKMQIEKEAEANEKEALSEISHEFLGPRSSKGVSRRKPSPSKK